MIFANLAPAFDMVFHLEDAFCLILESHRNSFLEKKIKVVVNEYLDRIAREPHRERFLMMQMRGAVIQLSMATALEPFQEALGWKYRLLKIWLVFEKTVALIEWYIPVFSLKRQYEHFRQQDGFARFEHMKQHIRRQILEGREHLVPILQRVEFAARLARGVFPDLQG